MNNPAPSRNEASVAGFEAGAAGVTPPSSSTGRHGVFLTEVIVEMGFAGKERVDEAENAARVSGKTVEQLLLDNRVIDENQLSLAIAERNGLDHVDLERFDADMKAAECVGREVAARCGAVPIAFASDGALIVAVQDSFDSLAVRRIETATGREARPAIAAVSAIKRLIERLPDEAPEQSPEADVPRIKSQRELQVDGSEASEAESARPGAAEEPQAKASPGEKPEPSAEAPSSFDDGLSMDLGPTVMEPGEKAPVEAPRSEAPSDAGARDERVAPELVETRGKVAELERRLEEVVGAAEEAAATREKLDALRRAIGESSPRG